MAKGKKKLTTAFGIPVADDQNSLTAGARGPVLMQDVHLLEKLGHFDRERIPERVVHAKGAGAGGYFEVTADVTKYTKAKFLSEIGKKTEVFDPDPVIFRQILPPTLDHPLASGPHKLLSLGLITNHRRIINNIQRKPMKPPR